MVNQNAARLGITLCKRHTASLPDVPKMLSDEINNFTKFAGWTKSLENIPKLGVEDLQKYFSSISKTLLKESTTVKKHFHRGEQLLEEIYLDINSIYTKQDDTVFCQGSLCCQSQKKRLGLLFPLRNPLTMLVSR